MVFFVFFFFCWLSRIIQFSYGKDFFRIRTIVTITVIQQNDVHRELKIQTTRWLDKKPHVNLERKKKVNIAGYSGFESIPCGALKLDHEGPNNEGITPIRVWWRGLVGGSLSNLCERECFKGGGAFHNRDKTGVPSDWRTNSAEAHTTFAIPLGTSPVPSDTKYLVKLESSQAERKFLTRLDKQ